MDSSSFTFRNLRRPASLFLAVALPLIVEPQLGHSQDSGSISSGIVEESADQKSEQPSAAGTEESLKSKLVKIPFIKKKKSEAEESVTEAASKPAEKVKKAAAPVKSAFNAVKKPVKKAAAAAASVTNVVKKEAPKPPAVPPIPKPAAPAPVAAQPVAAPETVAAEVVEAEVEEQSARKPKLFNLFRKKKEESNGDAEPVFESVATSDAPDGPAANAAPTGRSGEFAAASASSNASDGGTVIVPPRTQLTAQEQKPKWTGFRFGKKESEEEFPVALEGANVNPADLQLSGDGLEVIYEEGRFVNPRQAPLASEEASAQSTGPREEPVIINGVKTYRSWRDINARRPSVSERLLKRR